MRCKTHCEPHGHCGLDVDIKGTRREMWSYLKMAMPASVRDFLFVTTGAYELLDWRIAPLSTPPTVETPDS